MALANNAEVARTHYPVVAGRVGSLLSCAAAGNRRITALVVDALVLGARLTIVAARLAGAATLKFEIHLVLTAGSNGVARVDGAGIEVVTVGAADATTCPLLGVLA